MNGITRLWTSMLAQTTILVLIAQELSLSGLRKEITETWEHGNMETW